MLGHIPNHLDHLGNLGGILPQLADPRCRGGDEGGTVTDFRHGLCHGQIALLRHLARFPCEGRGGGGGLAYVFYALQNLIKCLGNQLRGLVLLVDPLADLP